VDPVLLRIAFVVLGIAGGGGVLLYIIAWIVIPAEKAGEPLGEAGPSSADTARLVIGGTLIVVGMILLLDLSFPRLALVALGVAVIVQASSSRR